MDPASEDVNTMAGNLLCFELLMLHDTHTFSGADASTTRSPDLGEIKEEKEETPNLHETI